MRDRGGVRSYQGANLPTVVPLFLIPLKEFVLLLSGASSFFFVVVPVFIFWGKGWILLGVLGFFDFLAVSVLGFLVRREFVRNPREDILKEILMRLMRRTSFPGRRWYC